jgi:hypothetical protein
MGLVVSSVTDPELMGFVFNWPHESESVNLNYGSESGA